jgi:hypothetical protein
MNRRHPLGIEKFISGGQTGVDRAALDVAIELGIEHGGWCPAGRLAEDGPISPAYNLRETASDKYDARTKANVRDSDGTLIITRGELAGGTLLTRRLAEERRKPWLVVDLDHHDVDSIYLAQSWITRERIRMLNVAGPRESTSPGIYFAAAAFLRNLFGPF